MAEECIAKASKCRDKLLKRQFLTQDDIQVPGRYRTDVEKIQVMNSEEMDTNSSLSSFRLVPGEII